MILLFNTTIIVVLLTFTIYNYSFFMREKGNTNLTSHHSTI